MADEKNMQTIKPEELDRVSGGTGAAPDHPGIGSGDGMNTLIIGGKNTAVKELQ